MSRPGPSQTPALSQQHAHSAAAASQRRSPRARPGPHRRLPAAPAYLQLLPSGHLHAQEEEVHQVALKLFLPLAGGVPGQERAQVGLPEDLHQLPWQPCGGARPRGWAGGWTRSTHSPTPVPADRVAGQGLRGEWRAPAA